MGNNAVVVVLTGSRLFFDESYEFPNVTFVAFNETDNIISTVPFEIVTPLGIPCRWMDVLARTNLIENVTSISLILGNSMEKIPFQIPKAKKHDVVTCVSPLFANEQWQYLIFAAHTYRKSV